jgi:hypothetical protein
MDIAQTLVTQTAKRTADARLGFATLSAMGSAASQAWERADMMAEFREQRLVGVAMSELDAYLAPKA